MNIIHSTQKTLNPANTFRNNDVLNFPLKTVAKKVHNKGWICNLSKQYAFSQQHHEYLQIHATKNISQFSLMCRLLEADTCRVIYFDEQLLPEQLLILRRKQQGSQTELLHAKIAFMFSAEVATLYA